MKPRGAIRADRADALQLLFLIAPAFVYLVVFQYVPMWGAQIAFKDYSAGLGTWQSPWAGFKHFR